ncbi:MAG: hypothetical protein U0V48_09685 [Anaerolineales bacterium]
MSTESLTVTPESSPISKKPFADSTFARIVKYTAVRVLTMAVTITIGVYLTILIANMGGYVDTIMRNEIRDGTTQAILANPSFRNLTEAKQKLIQEKIASDEKRLGLDQPFAVRSMKYLVNG